jgi:electron transport complex protein RnfB
MAIDSLIDAIDNVLPQTQCRLCGYDGCKPYARAIALQNDAITKCLPGGIPTLIKLGELTSQDAASSIKEMQQKTKPASIVRINESECIGCTKCIQACPVDAILGAAKQMHTVIEAECTGCELCIAPCPVDCIEIIPVESASESIRCEQANLARDRFNSRNERLKAAIDDTETPAQKQILSEEDKIQTHKMAIKEAIARVKARKNTQNEC